MKNQNNINDCLICFLSTIRYKRVIISRINSDDIDVHTEVTQGFACPECYEFLTGQKVFSDV